MMSLLKTMARSRRCRYFAALSTAVTIVCTHPPAQALTLVRNFVGEGEFFAHTSWQGSSASPLTAGGGDLINIFDAAATAWEQAIEDDWTVALNFGWIDEASADGALGLHWGFRRDSEFNRIIESDVVFNSGLYSWFLDPTPKTDEEYDVFTESFADLGGGLVNTGRIASNPIDTAAQNFDLFSVALHEIGHALGFSGLYDLNGDLAITSPRPYAGTVIPMETESSHTSIETALMYPFLGAGTRKRLSDVDILASAELSDFSQLNLKLTDDPEPGTTPEPSALVALAGFALLGLGMSRDRKN